MQPCVSHCLSIDVESFVESNAESFPIPERYFDPAPEASEIETNVAAVLEFLDRLAIKATFFVLGRIAAAQPNVVKRIAAAGHEVGSHGYHHLRIFLRAPEDFRKDVIKSKRVLEDASGQAVYGFRAPDFSIRANSLWAVDILREAGFEYDSSLTPTDIHDVYGVPGSQRFTHRLPNGLWEFPPSTFTLLGRTLPFGGGGYMRLYPVWLTRLLARKYEKRRMPCMFYMHPYELGPEFPKIREISWQRRFRHYYSIRSGGDKLESAIRGLRFDTAISILRKHRLEQDEPK